MFCTSQILLYLLLVTTLVVFKSAAWKGIPPVKEPVSLDGILNNMDAHDADALRVLTKRHAIVHTRYKYHKCIRQQTEVYNRTAYKDIEQRRVIYFEVDSSQTPRCVIVSVYVAPSKFLDPPRFLVNLCLLRIFHIRNGGLRSWWVLEFIFDQKIPAKTYVTAAVRQGVA